MYSRKEKNRILNNFEDIRHKLVLMPNGEMIGVNDVIFTEHKKIVTPYFGLGKKYEKIEYSMDEIHFKGKYTKEGHVSVWSHESTGGALGLEIRLYHLQDGRKRYLKMKDTLKGIGFNIVKLPKKKTK